MNNSLWQGNRIKHESKNPLLKLILKKFHSDVYKMCLPTSPKKILEVGCGEGFVAKFLSTRLRSSVFKAIDKEEGYISYAKTYNSSPNVDFEIMDLFNPQYSKGSFDLVICLEVLEHLTDPGKAIEQMVNLSKKYVLLSVPNEPFFSMANILRLKYLKTFGNPPIHIQKWNSKKFKSFVKSYGEIVMFKSSSFWNIVLLKKF